MATNTDYVLYRNVLNRMNITWEPDEAMRCNVENAIEEAQDYLRNVAGNPGLSFAAGELRGLMATCAWYIIENKKADFIQEYAGELLGLRLREGFSCGK